MHSLPGAILYHEWRDASTYRVGPSFRILEDGSIVAGERLLAKIASCQWIHITIACGLGKRPLPPGR